MAQKGLIWALREAHFYPKTAKGRQRPSKTVGFFPVFLFGTHKLSQIDIGAGGPFCILLDLKNVDFLSKRDFGEIDFRNDRLQLKINVNPASWDYSRPF